MPNMKRYSYYDILEFKKSSHVVPLIYRNTFYLTNNNIYYNFMKNSLYDSIQYNKHNLNPPLQPSH